MLAKEEELKKIVENLQFGLQVVDNLKVRAHFLHAQVAEVNALETVNKMLSLGDAVIA